MKRYKRKFEEGIKEDIKLIKDIVKKETKNDMDPSLVEWAMGALKKGKTISQVLIMLGLPISEK